MKGALNSILYFILAMGICGLSAGNPIPKGDTAIIHMTADFKISGKGDNTAWNKATWQLFTKNDSGGKNYISKSKMLYSVTGLYLLFEGEDDLITTKNYKDDDEIYEGDVFEFFLKSDSSKRTYFEYEINQMNKQLVLILSGSAGRNLAWSPWRVEYKRDPLIQKKINIRSKINSYIQKKTGVTIKPGDVIGGWSAEIFLPYELLNLLPGIPPKSGMVWRANFCRIDYDSGKMIQWTWSKQIKSSFHELDNFGFILFD